eukprot:4158555-Pleurochrysis_carterae.AAC.2
MEASKAEALAAMEAAVAEARESARGEALALRESLEADRARCQRLEAELESEKCAHAKALASSLASAADGPAAAPEAEPAAAPSLPQSPTDPLRSRAFGAEADLKAQLSSAIAERDARASELLRCQEQLAQAKSDLLNLRLSLEDDPNDETLKETSQSARGKQNMMGFFAKKNRS